LKVKVDDHFAVDGGRATWRDAVESGEKMLSGSAFYISANAVPEEGGLLASALLAAPDKKLAILPQGEARIEKLDELELRAGGQTRKVIQYSIEGLGLEPQMLWLDEDRRYFGQVSAWLSIIREGWKESIPQLLAAGDRARSKRSEKMAHSLGRPLTQSWVIRGGNLFDAEHEKLLHDYSVVGSGDRITAVGPTGSLAVPSGAEVIDAAGKTVLPGLWDMHAHIFESQGPLYIACGVTTVRDLANDIDALGDLTRRIDAREAIGPSIIPAGFLDGSGPYAGPTKVLVNTEAEARAAIDRYKQLNYPQIKIYSSIKPDLVPFIINYSHRLGLRVSGHVPAGMNAEDAVRAGFDELQHVNFLFLNFLVDRSADTRTPLRFTALAEHAAELDLSSPKVKAFIALLKERHVVVDPTVSVFEGMLASPAGQVSPTYASIAPRLPPITQRTLKGGGLAAATGEANSRAFDALLKMVGLLYRAGIPLVAGTDALLPGFVVHRELELYVQAGLPPPAVLRIATLGAAKVMKRDRESGSVASGKQADLIIVDGNPTERISDIRKIKTVVKQGVLYDARQLEDRIGLASRSTGQSL
ncbi:MAG TPA: amidohydrolase family protein, partial [Myxococcaceae bacterium]|nr:amidohydrolase family protein [Myxococcaceae bacterium]